MFVFHLIMRDEAFFIITILSVVIFFTLIIIRTVSYFVLKNIIKGYLNIKKRFSTKENQSTNRDDKKERDKEKEKKLDKVVVMNQEQAILQQFEQTKIVGVVKPIGKWTKLILGQKVGYMMQQANALKEQTGHGYWQTMMNSHDTRRGKGQGR